MKSFRILLLCFLFVHTLNLSYAQTTKLDKTSEGNEKLPTDFKPDEGTLLIEENIADDSSSVNLSMYHSTKTGDYMNYYIGKNAKAMREYADKNYTYKHEFASEKDIYDSASKYNDKNVFRFALVTSLAKPPQYMYQEKNMRTGTFEHNGQFQSSYNQPIFKYYIYDRLTDKTYAALGHGSSLVMWSFKSAIKKISSVK